MTRRVFHQAVPRSAGKQQTRKRKSFWWWLTRIPVLVLRILLAPFRMYGMVRRSMTAASVTLLLISIVSLNIIWGYPWSGMFAACVSLMLVGWVTNWLMQPKLEIGFSLPRSSVAGQPFAVTTHAKNIGWLPAMDLSIGFGKPNTPLVQSSVSGRKVRKRRRARNRGDGFSLREPHSVSLIQVGQRIHRSGSVRFDRRGVHSLPDLQVTSMFPFHLFRSAQRYESGTTIAVTPKLLTGDEDDLARSLLDALGNWSHRLLAGDALDYTGSREYEVGMSVRRWDFSSWARLGRPIVREFQSPTIQMVTLVIDTSVDEGDDPEKVERVLSLAATSVTELTRKSVRVGMFVTHPQDSDLQVSDPGLSPGDTESLLIRLAEAKLVEPEEADRQIHRVVEQMRHTPMLVLTARSDVMIDVKATALSLLRIDPPELTSPRELQSRRSEAETSAAGTASTTGGAE